MVGCREVFRAFTKKKILVVGDLLLDRYTFGTSKRISPEAPVPVVFVERQEERPGGVGNVACNLHCLGMEPLLVARVGCDQAGKTLRAVLKKNGVDTTWVVDDPQFSTTIKERVIASSQQIVRIDYETISSLSQEQEQYIIANLPDMLREVHLVAISDYAKGFFTQNLLRALIDAATKAGIPVIADPKGTDMQRYRGVYLLKPNAKEAYAAVPTKTTLPEVAQEILRITQSDVLMVTRSEEGISLFFPEGQQEDHKVVAREVKDVTGAGDTVLAMLAAALASGASISQATDLANYAAQVAIEKIGCATVSLHEVLLRMAEHEKSTKVLDALHLPLLQEMLGNTPFVHLNLASEEDFTHGFFLAVCNAAAEGKKVVVSVPRHESLLSTLTAMNEVSYVVLHTS